jgi:hypothetical protein
LIKPRPGHRLCRGGIDQDEVGRFWSNPFKLRFAAQIAILRSTAKLLVSGASVWRALSLSFPKKLPTSSTSQHRNPASRSSAKQKKLGCPRLRNLSFFERIAIKWLRSRSGWSPGRPSMRTGFFATISFSTATVNTPCRIGLVGLAGLALKKSL